MAELTLADLKPGPAHYQSSRALFDVLTGEDAAALLMESSSSGDDTPLQKMLSQPQWAKIALAEQHCTYHEHRPSLDENDMREVFAMPLLHLERAIHKAAVNCHAGAVRELLNFASQQGVDPVSVIMRRVVEETIKKEHAAVMEAMVSADPKMLTFDIGHGIWPLGLSARLRQTDTKPIGSYGSSLLSLATTARDTRMMELVLARGISVARSGALHSAAESGALEKMRLLLQHGANVDEILSEDILPLRNASMYATWTPMYFAAYGDQLEAMKLLESEGARSDVRDRYGRTAAQLLEYRRLVGIIGAVDEADRLHYEAQGPSCYEGVRWWWNDTRGFAGGT